MTEHELLYNPIKARQTKLREQVKLETLIPKRSFEIWLSLNLHRLADRLEPKPLTLNCETCS